MRPLRCLTPAITRWTTARKALLLSGRVDRVVGRRHVYLIKCRRSVHWHITHWTRNALAYVPKGQHTMLAAALRQAFHQPDHAAARTALLHVADMMRARWPKLADFLIDSEADVLAHMTFPSQHRTKLHSTNPLEGLNKEVKRRADVVGIFPNEDSIIRLIGAVLLEANDDWQLQHRYMQIEGMAELNTAPADKHRLQLTPQAE